MTTHITKYEHETFKGYRVAAQKYGILITKYFSYHKHGEVDAKKLAEEYRDDLMVGLSKCTSAQDVLDLRETM